MATTPFLAENAVPSANGATVAGEANTAEHTSMMDRAWRRLTYRHPDPDDPRQVRAQARLTAYENRTAWPMVVLALGYLVIYSFFVLDQSLDATQRSTLNIAMNVIWVVFIIDLIIRAALAPRHLAYLVHHPIDVIAVAIPALRVLRVLRVLTAGQWLIQRGSRLRFGRSATAVVIAVVFVTYLGSLAVLNAERGAPGADIETFPDALWWSMVTMATVGYGDYVPVTTYGRIIAVGIMVVGISLLGLVGATVASAVISRITGSQKQGQDEVRAQLQQLVSEVSALRQQLSDAGVIGEHSTKPDSASQSPPA